MKYSDEMGSDLREFQAGLDKLKQMMRAGSFVCEGDTVICHSMDRLARNLDDLRRTVLV